MFHQTSYNSQNIPVPTVQSQPILYDPNQQMQFQPIQYQQNLGLAQQTQPTVPCFIQSQPIQPFSNTNFCSNQQSYITPQQNATVTESEWKTVSNKKRLRSPEETSIRKQTKITEYWLQKPIKTHNRFNGLEKEDDKSNEEEEPNIPTTIPKPPPITIYKVGYIEHIHKILSAIAPEKYTVKALGPETVKVQLLTPEHYLAAVKALDEKHTEYHTYRPKNEKNFRAVMLGLHPSTDTDIVKKELKERGHEVVNLHKIKDRDTKKELPVWFIDIKPNQNNKDIFNITRLAHSVIKFEPPHVKRIIPQCSRCQDFGHTKNYCRKSARCVKCAGVHLTTECERNVRDNNVKCVNCNLNHPANYRGCMVYQQLQKRLYPQLREKINTTPQVAFNPSQQIQPGMSFAQVTKNNPQNNNQTLTYSQQTNNMSKLEEMLGRLMEQLGTVLNLLTTVIGKLA